MLSDIHTTLCPQFCKLETNSPKFILHIKLDTVNIKINFVKITVKVKVNLIIRLKRNLRESAFSQKHIVKSQNRVLFPNFLRKKSGRWSAAAILTDEQAKKFIFLQIITHFYATNAGRQHENFAYPIISKNQKKKKPPGIA